MQIFTLQFFLKKRDSVKTLMKENEIMSVNQIFHSEIAKIMRRVDLNTIPTPFIDIFKNQRRTATMVTRCSSNLFQSFTSFQKCKPSISYTGPYIWNSLPVELKSITTNDEPINEYVSETSDKYGKSFISKFMKKMKKFVLNNINFI